MGFNPGNIFEQGMSTKNISRCELLGKLMEDKLYAHHAVQDSLEISDQEIYDYVGQSIDYFIEQLGSIESLIIYLNARDEWRKFNRRTT